MLLFQMYTSDQFHIVSKCTTLSSYQMWQKPAHAKDLVLDHKIVWGMVKLL